MSTHLIKIAEMLVCTKTQNPNDAYTCLLKGSSLGDVMTCRLFCVCAITCGNTQLLQIRPVERKIKQISIKYKNFTSK